ncbi:MAG: hypothetical protein ABIL66_08580 [candidate division WOR-3 bacterium]
MDYIFIGLVIAILCVLLDEIFPKLRNPNYFKNLIRLYTFEKVIPNLQKNLSDANGINDALRMYIKNKYHFFPVSPREIFFREVQFDYSVSRYTVCPIHGTIELVNPQKIRIIFCLNLTIPAFLAFISILLFYHFPQTSITLIILFFLLVSCFWYYILIKKRIQILIETITRWLTLHPKYNHSTIP